MQKRLVKDSSAGEDAQDITVLSQELISLIRQDGSVHKIMKLIKIGAQVNARSLHGMTPLMVAARRNRGTICAFLITKGALLNVKDHEGMTVLDYAISTNNIKLCRLLISHGADPHPSSVEPTLLMRSLLNKCDYKLYKYLISCGAKL